MAVARTTPDRPAFLPEGQCGCGGTSRGIAWLVRASCTLTGQPVPAHGTVIESGLASAAISPGPRPRPGPGARRDLPGPLAAAPARRRPQHAPPRYGRLHGQARTHRRPSRSGRSAPDPEFGTDERLAAATVYSVLWWARLQGRPDDVEDPQNGQSTARSTWARMSRRRDRTSGSRSDHAAARTCWWSMLSAGQKLTASPRWPRSPGQTRRPAPSGPRALRASRSLISGRWPRADSCKRAGPV
jgi:hypothetical protein